MRTRQILRTPLIARHVHKNAYAALVLSGSYEEAGDSGRHQVQPGNVVLHDGFDGHLDRIPTSGAMVLNIPLHSGFAFSPGLRTLHDPDTIVRLVERKDTEAAAELLRTARICHRPFSDWPDELAASLAQDACVNLSDWSEAKEIHPWRVSRCFTQVFGISPSAFRARARTRQAWRAIRTSATPLSEIAAHLGFADQAHLTRSVTSMTGLCPTAWRSACK